MNEYFNFAHCSGRKIWFLDSDSIPVGVSFQKGDIAVSKSSGKFMGIYDGTAFVNGEQGNKTSVTTDNTAGNLTITADMVIGGILERDPAGGNRTDTLPSAALLVAGLDNPYVGQTLDFLVVNTADAAETVTIAAGSGGTLKPGTPAAVGQNQARLYKIRLTNVTSSSESYDVYAVTG